MAETEMTDTEMFGTETTETAEVTPAAKPKSKKPTRAKPAADTEAVMSVLLLRGYNPTAGLLNKKKAGETIEVAAKVGRKLIKTGVATFPDEDE